MITFSKDLQWSPDGYTVTTVKAGEYGEGELSARVVKIAEQMGILSTTGDGDTGQQSDPDVKKGKK